MRAPCAAEPGRGSRTAVPSDSCHYRPRRQGRAEIWHDQVPPLGPHEAFCPTASFQLAQWLPYSQATKPAQDRMACCIAAFWLRWLPLEPSCA